MEIRLSRLAEKKIREFAVTHNEEPIVRVYVTKAACSGARFGIAIDNIRDNDEITNINGIKVVTDTEYVPVYSDGINIDYFEGTKEGFMISSLRQIKSGCGEHDHEGCSKNGGCGGCSGGKN